MATLREALEEGYDELDKGSEPAPAETPPAEPVTTGAAGHDEPVEPAVVGASTEPTATDDRPRGPDGKFVKVEKVPEAPKDAKAAPPPGQVAAAGTPPSPAAAPVLPELKPPQAWRTMAREKWKSLPREVQEEAIRAENEAKAEIRQRAEAHKNWERFQQAAEPFKSFLAAAGNDPVASATQLWQTAAQLQTGTPDAVASIAASIISNYGVSRFGPQFVEKVAAYLNGQAGPAIQPQQQGLRREDIDKILEERFKGMQEQALQRRAQTELEKFEVNPPEFYDHPGIKQRMARILEANDEDGVALSYQEAYDLAVASHQEIKKVLEQRAAAKNAATAQAATQRVRAAASSVRTQPAAAGVAEPEGRRAALERAYDELASR